MNGLDDKNKQRDLLRLYVNRKLIAEKVKYIPLLYPFFKRDFGFNTPSLGAVFDKYNFDKNYYTLVDNIDDAEFALIPYSYWALKHECPELLKEFIKEANKHKKLILIDAYGDRTDKINVRNSIILRLSQYRFRLRKNDIIVPVYTEDLLDIYSHGSLQLRNKSDIPSVGFAGWANLAPGQFIKFLIKETPIRLASIFDARYSTLQKGVFWRQRALRVLQKSNLIKQNFIVRQSYSGSLKTVRGDYQQAREEFVNNILGSDYALCVKGDANASTRFYEALSLGRIPIFLDTESVNPLEDLINYREFCVFVSYRDINCLDKIIFEFHRSIDNEKFIQMQKRARDVFQNYLRIDNFTKYLVARLREKAAAKEVL